MKSLLWAEATFKPYAAVNTKMVLAALAMLIFGTLDVGFGLQHNLDAFIYKGVDPEVHFGRTSYWVNVMKMVTYVAQTFVGDGILIYRCWVVYDKNWWIVLVPILLWLGGTACGIVTAYIEATLLDVSGLLNSSQLIPFISGMLSLTLATNVLTTGMIVYRIWSIQNSLKHRANQLSNTPLDRLISILIESGGLYTASVIALFIAYLLSSNAQLAISDSVVQIIGITFNLVIISVDSVTSTQSSAGRAPASSYVVSSPTSVSGPHQNRYMINIERSVERDWAKAETGITDVPLDSLRFEPAYYR